MTAMNDLTIKFRLRIMELVERYCEKGVIQSALLSDRFTAAYIFPLHRYSISF